MTKSRSWLLSSSLVLGACGLMGTVGCKKTPDPEAKGGAKAGPAGEAETDGAGDDADTAEAPVKVGPEQLLSWLDPDATSVAFLRDLGHLDPEAMASVFAIPPAAEELIEPLEELDWALEVVLGHEGPKPDEVFSSAMLAFKPAVAQRPYIVRGLKIGQDEVVAALGDEMAPSTVESIDILTPKGAFAYKLAFIEPGLVAFVPVGEIGSGLGPLTNGRDMPAKEIETEMLGALTSDPDLLGIVVAAGPLMHLDIDEQVARFRLTMRRFERKGLDVEVAMQLMIEDGDATEVAKELDARRPSFESDRIADMAEKVAFTAEGPVAVGRLQLTPEMVGALEQPI